MTGPYDVLTMGRIGVDVYPMQVGVALEDVETFGKWLGGTATNVAVAAARHGRRSAVISRVGADPFGTFVHNALRGYDVDDRYVTPVPGLPTPVTFCEIFPPDDFPIYFYRYPKAPDLEIHSDELDLDAIAAAGIFWVTGTGLCAEPSRTATLAALEHREAATPRLRTRKAAVAGTEADLRGGDVRGITVLDLDYRPAFWASREEAGEQMRRALPYVTVAVGNLDECHTAVGTRDPVEAAARLREAGVRVAIVKRGPEGVLAVADTGTYEIPPMDIEVVNGLGAGDAFGGALCHGMLANWPTEQIMRFANAAGAIVASRLACSDAMPTTAEVDDLLAAAGNEADEATR